MAIRKKKNDCELEISIDDMLNMPKCLFELFENDKEEFSIEYPKWKRKYKK